jgi:carbamoyl-phosphate synthase small subunit
MRAILALEDGTWFEGRSVTGQGEAGGEVIFNTGMTGYQEILTDPSYRGQLVCMTYPHIGNYGVNPDDVESERVQVAGFIVKECCRLPSNWRSRLTLPEYLEQHGIMGLEGIDTRALTRHLRLQGAMRGYIAAGESDPKQVVAKARSIPEMEGQNLVDAVTPQTPFVWTPEGPQPIDDPERFVWPEAKPRVIVCDCGAKWNIMRRLEKEGFQVVGVPAFYSADRIKAFNPDALFLSNGPGDPAALPELVHTVASLVDAFPIGGICLGHQILGIALGGSSFKLKFGHHGVNHPVRHLATGKIEITSQNHGFCVSTEGLDDVEQTHINLNDTTLEGFVHRRKPIMAVQYHPEASPGPHDSRYFFRGFAHMVKETLGVAH